MKLEKGEKWTKENLIHHLKRGYKIYPKDKETFNILKEWFQNFWQSENLNYFDGYYSFIGLIKKDDKPYGLTSGITFNEEITGVNIKYNIDVAFEDLDQIYESNKEENFKILNQWNQLQYYIKENFPACSLKNNLPAQITLFKGFEHLGTLEMTIDPKSSIGTIWNVRLEKNKIVYYGLLNNQPVKFWDSPKYAIEVPITTIKEFIENFQGEYRNLILRNLTAKEIILKDVIGKQT